MIELEKDWEVDKLEVSHVGRQYCVIFGIVGKVNVVGRNCPRVWVAQMCESHMERSCCIGEKWLSLNRKVESSHYYTWFSAGSPRFDLVGLQVLDLLHVD